MSQPSLNAQQRDAFYQAAARQLAIAPEQMASYCQFASDKLIVRFPFACQTHFAELQKAFKAIAGEHADVEFVIDVEAKKTRTQRLPRVKNMIAVASGKGGVGKSATSVNLAFALQRQGASVGILDADIYGPSVPIMLGNPLASPQSEDNRHMFPLQCQGIYANSIGYLVPPENATIWRGPMASKALQQLINETLWPDLDYLIVDMPPGTGDIQLTLSQMVPLTAAVVVTTPQDIALADAKKGIAMFEKVDIPVLGLIENMSYYQCRQCGHKDFIFASGGGQKLATEHLVPLLGQLPLDITIREHADGGKPLLLENTAPEINQAYLALAEAVSKQLAMTANLKNDDVIIQTRQ